MAQPKADAIENESPTDKAKVTMQEMDQTEAGTTQADQHLQEDKESLEEKRERKLQEVLANCAPSGRKHYELYPWKLKQLKEKILTDDYTVVYRDAKLENADGSIREYPWI